MRRRLSSYARSLARVKDLCGQSVASSSFSFVRPFARSAKGRTDADADGR